MRIFLTSLILLISTAIFSQHLTDRYASLDIGFGPRSYSSTAGSYNLSFNTSTSAYSFDKEISESFDFFGFNLGLSFGKYKGLNHQLYFGNPFGGQGSGKFGYSLGWGFAFEIGDFDLLLRPAIGIATGNTNITFGSFTVDTLGQVLLDEEFNDETVEINLEQNSNYFIPEIKASFLFAQKLGVFVAVAYDIDFANKQQDFRFSAEGSKTLELTDPYISYTRTDFIPAVAVTDNIYDPGGLRISFGISIYYNKDLYD